MLKLLIKSFLLLSLNTFALDKEAIKSLASKSDISVDDIKVGTKNIVISGSAKNWKSTGKFIQDLKADPKIKKTFYKQDSSKSYGFEITCELK